MATRKTPVIAEETVKAPVVELHLKVRSHYKKLVASKLLAGLPDSLARDTARRQIEHDHGTDVVKAALAANELDRDEAIATAGVNSNAAQSVDRKPGEPETEVHFDEERTATE